MSAHILSGCDGVRCPVRDASMTPITTTMRAPLFRIRSASALLFPPFRRPPSSLRPPPFFSPSSTLRPLSRPLLSSFSSSSSSSSSGTSSSSSSGEEERAEGADGTERKIFSWDSTSRTWRVTAVVLSVLAVGGMTAFIRRGHSLYPGRKWTLSALPGEFIEGLSDWIWPIFGLSDTPLLPEPRPDAFGRQPRTLVLGVEDVVSHIEWDRFNGYEPKVRPDLGLLLEAAANSGWEIVFFSNKLQYETEQLLQYLDPNMFVRNRLYGESRNFRSFHYVKDLERLQRDFSRLLVIDISTRDYWQHADNVLILPSFKTADPNDRELRKLVPIVEKIMRYNVPDIREVIRRLSAGATSDELFKEDEELLRKATMELDSRRRGHRRARAQMKKEQQDPTTDVPAPTSRLDRLRGWIGWQPSQTASNS